MADLAYVFLTDTHFGAPNSLLTNLKTASSDADPLEPSPVLRSLAACLATLVEQNTGNEKPTLVLGGDILELALATTNQAAMAFTRFAELLFPEQGEPLFDRIVFIPGNHDHHLWEIARETQYLNHVATLDVGTVLPIPWHATSMFEKSKTKKVPECFLTGLLRRLGHVDATEERVTTFYPNFGVVTKNRKRAVVFTHGHFVEPIYRLMSTLRSMVFPDRKPPVHVWDLEAENFAWIDFFWSAMGRSGEVGADIGLIYDRLQDEDAREALLAALARSLAERYDLPGWGDAMEAQLLEWAFEAIGKQVEGLERHQAGTRALTPAAEKGLWTYVEGPLKQQMLIELGQSMPPDITLLFGHTHKPFAEDLNFAGFGQWVDTYNSGGWVVDSVDPELQHGAAVVLVDRRHSAVAVRLYNETEDRGISPVRVEQSTHAAEPDTPFYRAVRDQVAPDADPWLSLSQQIAEAVSKRRQHLRARVNGSES